MYFDMYWVLTKKCNLECRHCYISAGPKEKETMSVDDFALSVQNLPKTSGRVYLSGGEVFLLDIFSYLDVVKEENAKRKKKKQHAIDIGLQSNGFWGKRKNLDTYLTRLGEANVSFLELASGDKFHEEEGVEKSELKKLVAAAEEAGIRSCVSGHSGDDRFVFPIGRGRELVEEVDCKVRYKMLCQSRLDIYDLVVYPEGTVSFCCYGYRELGNIKEEPLVNMVRRARKDERLSILNKKGIRGLALHDGWRAEDIKDLREIQGDCATCYRLFKDEFILE